MSGEIKEESLVDEGKRVKKIINGECYYVYVPNKGEQVVSGPRENFPTLKHDRDILGVASKENSSYMDCGYKEHPAGNGDTRLD